MKRKEIKQNDQRKQLGMKKIKEDEISKRKVLINAEIKKWKLILEKKS